MKKTEEMQRAFELIKASEKIVITRHVRPDGDAIGSSMGLKEILCESFPDKDIRLINSDYSDTFSFLGDEDCQVSPDWYSDALSIVTDTANLDRVSNKLVRNSGKMLKIDHHFEAEVYGDVSWVESSCSSTCEMIAFFQETFSSELKLTQHAAQCLYTGIVTDCGDFRYRGTDGDTLRTAARLLDTGIDIQYIQSCISLEEPSLLRFQEYVLRSFRITENGVAYVYVSQRVQKRFKLNREQASSCVQFISGIKGVYIWVAFIENTDRSIRARVRSREIDIIPLCTKFGGGGHMNACGATCKTRSELRDFVSEADSIVKNFKAGKTE